MSNIIRSKTKKILLNINNSVLYNNNIKYLSSLSIIITLSLLLPCVYTSSEYNNVSIFHTYHQTSSSNYFINNRININNNSIYLTNNNNHNNKKSEDDYINDDEVDGDLSSLHSYECSLCRQREQIKELSLLKIKELVLKKLGFGDTPPVRKKYPKIPISIIQSLNHEDIDDEGFEEMQSDDPNSSRNFVYHTTNNNKDDNDDIDNDESYEFDDPYSKDRLYAFPVSKYYLIFSFFIFFIYFICFPSLTFWASCLSH